MRIAIVENTKVTHHGQLGVALHMAGALIDQYRPYAGGTLPQRGSYDALVVFGGEQSALDDARYPYLPHLAAQMAQDAADGVAVLGICLGAQIFARGLGAQNHLGSAPEFGWCPIDRAQGAAQDAMFAPLPAQFDAFQWHSDTFTLPPGAVQLASGGRALVQAFRYGRAGYATQFHFEANRAVVADWTRSFAPTIAGMDATWADRYAACDRSQGAQADAAGLALAQAWLAVIER